MLYLSGIILSFFLSFVLITKRKKTDADYILFAWLIVTGFHLLTFYLFITNKYVEYPTLASLGFPLSLAQGPFLYIYTKQQTSYSAFNKKQLLHFLPLLLAYAMFSKFFLLPANQKVMVFNKQGHGYATQMLIDLIAVYISGIIYIILSLVQLIKYKKNIIHQFSNTDKINFNWLLYLIIWMMIIWMFVLFVQDDKWIFGAAALFVIWLGYFGIKQVQVFSHISEKQSSLQVEDKSSERETALSEPTSISATSISDGVANVKYIKSSLGENQASLIHERLTQLLLEEKIFTNPDLTLNDLAKSMDVHPNHLSQGY